MSDLVQQATAVNTFTCPRCGSTSWHVEDVRQGYCGACHAFTREQVPQ
jgi:ribosomal protein L37E